MRDLMLDVECGGTGNRGALMGVGAVFFDENSSATGAEFYRAVNLATAVRRGGELDPSTFVWWLNQPDEVRQAVIWNTYAIEDVMAEFREFVVANCRPEDVYVWGCSPTFDCEKVRFAMGQCGVETPWKYFNERCYRTIRERNLIVPQDERFGLHNALADAKYQAAHLQKIRTFHRAKRNA